MEVFDLSGRIALITGGGGGLGRAFANALADAGANVFCADRDLEGAGETAQAIRRRNKKASAVSVCVESEPAVSAMVDKVIGEAGAIDILINNAGIATTPHRTHEMPVDDWDRMVGINLRGTFLVSRAVLPHMLGNKRGSIINLSSIIGLGGIYPGFAMTTPTYAATKAAIVGLTRQMALEYATDGIRVNAVAPGWHGGTSLGAERRANASDIENDRFGRQILSSIPMGRLGRTDEINGLVLYLASDASSYVTGQTFAHDGGITAA